MTTRSFFIALTVGLTGTAVLFVLATILDVPVLRVAGLVFLLGVLAARERWARGRAWLIVPGLLVAVIGVAALVQWLA